MYVTHTLYYASDHCISAKIVTRSFSHNTNRIVVKRICEACDHTLCLPRAGRSVRQALQWSQQSIWIANNNKVLSTCICALPQAFIQNKKYSENHDYSNFDYPNTQLSEHFASVLAQMHTLISNLNYPNSQLSKHFFCPSYFG